MALRIGVLPLARPTFDVPYAEDMARAAFAALEGAGFDLVGGRALLFDAGATKGALAALAQERLDLVLILQVTFTDATMTVEIAKEAKAPLAIWGFPEPRAGGRLRLNAFCGLNLAVHALGRNALASRWHYGAPDAPDAANALRALAQGVAPLPAKLPAHAASADDRAMARDILVDFADRKIGLVGEHPPGFDTCRFEASELAALTQTSVQQFQLSHLFERARVNAGIPGALDAWRDDASVLAGVDRLDQGELTKSLSLGAAFEEIQSDHRIDAFAVRCWPETFTEYGCAACGPMGFLTQAGTPCACEADVFGALTLMLLNELGDEPSWLVDIVDMDAASDTGVFWHCGSAPLSMADPDIEPRAQIHSNRKMALLQEFTLKPGRVTIARISQARNVTKMVLAGGEMLRAPMSFTGTSGVIRFDRNAGKVAAAMMAEGLEHHVGIVYGEHRDMLRALAAEMKIDVVELS